MVCASSFFGGQLEVFVPENAPPSAGPSKLENAMAPKLGSNARNALQHWLLARSQLEGSALYRRLLVLSRSGYFRETIERSKIERSTKAKAAVTVVTCRG
jgi:hypothetical protein